MFFTVYNMSALSLSRARTKIYREAQIKLAIFPMRASEIQLNNYCKDKYRKPLKHICYELLSRCTVAADTDNNYTVSFIRPEDDRLAALITYGNEVVPGSLILKFMFANPKIRKD